MQMGASCNSTVVRALESLPPAWRCTEQEDTARGCLQSNETSGCSGAPSPHSPPPPPPPPPPIFPPPISNSLLRRSHRRRRCFRHRFHLCFCRRRCRRWPSRRFCRFYCSCSRRPHRRRSRGDSRRCCRYFRLCRRRSHRRRCFLRPSVSAVAAAVFADADLAAAADLITAVIFCICA